MTDYKLVPVEPIRRAMDALERFANDTLAGRNSAHELRELLAAAPAVQGEPVGYVSQDFLDGKWNMDHIAKSDEGQISRTIPVFAKPPQPVDQQPAPDVAGLVEALEASPHGLHDSIDGEDDCRCSQCKFVRLRDAALAAYRQGGAQ